MDAILVAVAAFLGGIAIALLGWAESLEKFAIRKFVGSIIRSIIAAVSIAFLFDYMNNTAPLGYLAAFIMGLGGEAVLKRSVSALTTTVKSNWKIPPTTPTGLT